MDMMDGLSGQLQEGRIDRSGTYDGDLHPSTFELDGDGLFPCLSQVLPELV